MSNIRNSAKAIIIKDGKILMIKGIDRWGYFYILPGGGQNPFENLKETLIRECKEELNVNIIIHDIRYIREYIGKNHEFSEYDSHLHQVEYMFLCEIKDEENLKKGENPDNFQVDIEWIPLDKLSSYRIYPKILKDLIGKNGELLGPVYLGDVN
ncbi:MAG: NUDIX domain-containing protein [Dictyoglomus sp.]|nr:NUDIX domain-containing protein [Dictyoglomus sp.]MCX7942851.1 NUDIX domain-containing protein [Dictyoglomaceae bacterium]MDW8189079.1 NUDIX domain-containing protein [Dictyoglomus sp.]